LRVDAEVLKLIAPLTSIKNAPPFLVPALEEAFESSIIEEVNVILCELVPEAP
jgi:hypothetical protein